MKASYATAATFSFLSIIGNTNAQEKQKYEIGIRLSALTYQGDLTPSFIGSSKTITLGFGVFGTRILNDRLSVRANLDYNRLKGDDAAYSKPEWRQQRNFNFNASIVELSGHLVYNLRGNYSNRKFSPYIFGGAGLNFLKINRDYSSFNAEYFSTEAWVSEGLAADLEKTPPRFTIVMPVGAGFKYPISQKFSLFGEASYRLMLTDYLDGFSKISNTKNNDHYSNISVGLVYRLGNTGINCPKY